MRELLINHLIGMFAFAIYDLDSEKTLIVRDHFGIKPLFYTIDNNSIIFSSELKTLTQIPSFNKEINVKTIIKSINYLWIPGYESIFLNTKKVPPGHYMVIDKNLDFTINQYWKLNYSPPYNNEKEIIEKLEKEIKDPSLLKCINNQKLISNQFMINN